MDNSVAGSSAPPPPKLVLEFKSGVPTNKNKKQLVKACRELVRGQIGLSVGEWSNVPINTKKDLFRSIQTSFELEECHFEYTMQLMGIQLRTWRNQLRLKYFPKHISVAEIKRLRDHPPDGIPLAHWNTFIDREASETKIRERLQAVENRSHFSDEHNLGSTSYVEFEEKLEADGVEHDRADRYTLARNNKETGVIRPSAAKIVKRLEDAKRNLDPLDRHHVDRDAVAQVFGRDSHGRTRCVSSKVSKLKYQFLKSMSCKKTTSIKEDVANVRSEFSTQIKDLTSRVEKMEEERRFGGSSSASLPCSQLSPTIPLSTPPVRSSKEVRPSPSSSPCVLYSITGHLNYRRIAIGRASPIQIPGIIVNGEILRDYETKIHILSVHEGMEDTPLYKPLEEALVISQVIGRYIVWPTRLLDRL